MEDEDGECLQEIGYEIAIPQPSGRPPGDGPHDGNHGQREGQLHLACRPNFTPLLAAYRSKLTTGGAEQLRHAPFLLIVVKDNEL